MKINIITLFPDFFTTPLATSLLGKLISNKSLEINYINLRKFGTGKHQIVDDKPYSGGPGLILKVDIAKAALDSVGGKKIVMSASGKLINQQLVENLAKEKEITILCPRYEGFDERITRYVDAELSIGDFVLSGGEIPALALIDALSRLQPGFMHSYDSTKNESFKFKQDGKILLEYPQYTRPDTFDGQTIPQVLKSGDHKKIEEWQKTEAITKTKKNRPDMLI